MKDYVRGIGKLELISFSTGFILLAYELIAARIMAPSIGSSNYVWTSVIGIIIAALSLGYVAGGRIADARAKAIDVVWLLLASAGLIMLSRGLHPGVLDWVAAMDVDTRIQAVIAATVLFAPASFVLGAISPYLVKLKLTSLAESGRSVASLSATNSVGGIAGTFVTGFILFGFVGLLESLTFLVVALVLSSWLFVPRDRFMLRVGVSVLIILFSSLTPTNDDSISIDTPSAHYEVAQGLYNNRPSTFLLTGTFGIQSAIYNDYPDELVFWYINEFADVAESIQPKSIAVLGGGAYTLPDYFAREYPDALIDVIEIDPELEGISKQYFSYSAPSNVTSIGQDARTFVESTNKKYDYIVVDAYGDTEIPPSLMTKEFGDALARITAEDGVVAVNLIAGLTGECRAVFEAVDALYRRHFEHAIYKRAPQTEGMPRANHLIVYKNTPIEIASYDILDDLGGAGYTDNFIPSERLFHNCAAST